MRLPTQERLKSLLIYDPKTGHFYWRLLNRGRVHWWEGKRAGFLNKGSYVIIGVDGAVCFGHHLAWIYVYGEPAGCEIDHKNNTPCDNSIGNLRKATSSEQKRNKRVQSNNRCGLKGAYFHACRKGKKWRSQIRVDGRCVFLGYHDTPEQAHAAYAEAAVRYYGEFAKVA